MKLTFWGAAEQVTGSMYLLEIDDYQILIDCGFDMERERKKPEEDQFVPIATGSAFPFDPSLVNTVLLTHAHIDHSGNIPNLVREGFEGKIYCTNATYTLTQLLLSDSAHLNKKKWKRYDKIKFKLDRKKPLPNTNEWFTQNHVNRAEEQFSTTPFNRRVRIIEGVYATFIPVGHILGAACIFLEVKEGDQFKRIIFSGDIGRKNYPLLQDPHPIPQADYMLCETTYGDREHKLHGKAEDIVYNVINEACVEKAGRLIIPAFSVGRTQAILYTLHKLSVEGRLPAIKVFADSPLAFKTTEVYNRNVALLNEEAQNFCEDHESLFDFENLIYIPDIKTSKAIANHSEPCIIISSSGMIQGGRVTHHIKSNIQNSYATILMVGYAAEGTLGHQLMNGAKVLTTKGKDKDIPILATVKRIDIFSGHGDKNDLIDFVEYQDPSKLKKLFLIHGEKESMTAFSHCMTEKGYDNIEIPSYGETYEL